MSSYRIALTASAEKEMMPRLEHLAGAPRPPGCKKLKGGDNEWRIRVGDYRIVYEVDDAAKTVDVTRIAHRREAYK